MDRSKTIKKAAEICLVLLGNLMMAAGLGCFIIPADLMVGGSTGIGLVFSHYLGLPVPAVVGVYNIIMFLLGAWLLGRHFAVTTLLSSFLFPFLLGRVGLLVQAPLTSDPLLALILGGLLTGSGIGLVIRAGASTGGNDIPVLLLKKKFGVPLSISMYAFDIAILLLQLPYSGVEKALYSVVLVLLYSTMAEKASALGKSQMQVRIISKEYKQISQEIQRQIDRGTTLYRIEGGYSGEESCEVMTVLSGRNLNTLNKLVMDIDPKAFIMMARINEVKGRGFSFGKREP